MVWKNQPNTNIIRSEKSPEYEYEYEKKSPEYEYKYYSVWKIHPNTNTNIIQFEKIIRIRIRILFGLRKSPEYKYEYYSVSKSRPNTNTNTSIRLKYSNNIRIPKYSLTSGGNFRHCLETLKALKKIPDCVETFHTVWKLSRQARNCPDSLEILQTLWKLSRLSGNF